MKTLAVDRYWAKKTKVEPVPLSGGLILEGSDKSLEALIAETERALLVTRFWYIRSVNPQNAMVTGLTRDGVWLIENGKVVHPVNNFRFNDSPVNLLKNLEATSSAAVPAGSEFFVDDRPGDPGPRLPLHVEERRGLKVEQGQSPWTSPGGKRPFRQHRLDNRLIARVPTTLLGPAEELPGGFAVGLGLRFPRP